MAVVICSEEFGVYVGECLGLGFWSKLDAVGQDCAPVFENAEEAAEYAKTWVQPIENLKFVEVVADKVDARGNKSASIASCIRAGLPSWIDEFMPAMNVMPA